MQSSWRVITSGLLLAAAVWVFALREARQNGPPPPEWHVNAEAGFRIRPPTGWDNRTDDRDGSVLAPSTQPTDGFATLIVSTRLATERLTRNGTRRMCLQWQLWRCAVLSMHQTGLALIRVAAPRLPRLLSFIICSREHLLRF